jgi:maleylacetoacetate isomerase/maleylpyruvate isomerase
MKVYTWWRSLAAFRVRIVMNLKNVQAEAQEVDLRQGQQHDPAFQAINPQKAIPAIVLDDGGILFQSMAIMEYLNEVYPMPPLLPNSPVERARVRALAQIVVADGHPLVTPRVRAYLEQRLGHSEREYMSWAKHFMGEALAAMEGYLARDAETGVFSHGNQPTLADVCLVSQVVGYGYFGGVVDAFPTVNRVHEACMKIDAFQRSHPLQQPEAPKA